MANNRLYIHCNTCGHNELMAKYYPSNGWAAWDYLGPWLEEHSHPEKKTQWGVENGLPFSMSYEISTQSLVEALKNGTEG